MYQHRQIHVWISESDYLMLHERSAEEQESVSAILRKLIKAERLRMRDAHRAPGGFGDGPSVEALQ